MKSMRDMAAILNDFRITAESPQTQLKKLLAGDKKVVGLMPYFCPEELVHAAGLVPFGLWGAEIRANDSRRYFPAFICSILHTILEQGIRGDFSGMSAVLIPVSCDSLKGMQANWPYAVPDIPVIYLAHAQNRKMAAGREFTASQYRRVFNEMLSISGKSATDDDVRNSITLYNRKRALLRVFSSSAEKHPAAVSPSARSAVMRSAFYMEPERYISLLEELNAVLCVLPKTKWEGVRIVTTGICLDAPDLLRAFEESRIAIVGDQIAQESVLTDHDVDVNEASDPFEDLAAWISEVEGCSVLYDPDKKRAKRLAALATEKCADGVIFVLTQFCDPDEYDLVPVKKILAAAGIPCLVIETDRQMTDYGRARTQLETFISTL